MYTELVLHHNSNEPATEEKWDSHIVILTERPGMELVLHHNSNEPATERTEI
jgi:hypothetical protein